MIIVGPPRYVYLVLIEPTVTKILPYKFGSSCLNFVRKAKTRDLRNFITHKKISIKDFAVASFLGSVPFSHLADQRS